MILKSSDEDKIIKDYFEDCSLKGMAKGTMVSYRSCIKIYIQFLRTRDINLLMINKEILKDFISYLKKKRNLKYKTLSYYFSALSSLYEYLKFEEILNDNPVLLIRKRYITRYKETERDNRRKCPTNDEMSAFINSIFYCRDKAIAILLAKTGISREELIMLDVDEINWEELSIRLKPTAKRCDRTVYFDDECAQILKDWIRVRNELVYETQALFLNQRGGRLRRNGVYTAITKWAEKVGLHNPNSSKIEDHFSPHCFRHWFTTVLIRGGMRREYVKELRGDSRKDAVDIYNHIDQEELRRSYLACMPCLGV